MFSTEWISIDAKSYEVQVHRPVTQPITAPRLVVVAYQPNDLARQLAQACIRSIQQFTPDAYELWVVDNNSPLAYTGWLLEKPGVNVILNRTEPIPPHMDVAIAHNQHQHGSYANAIGVELAARLIDPDSYFVMTLHMDTAPCHPGWLAFLRSRLTDRVRAAGVRLDRVRVPDGVLHVLGFLFDFQLYRQLGLNFLPDLPRLDVGDRVSLALRAAGYGLFACPNTLWQPELAQTIPATSELRSLAVDRAFDDHGNVIFLHLGRGVSQAEGRIGARQVTVEDWVKWIDQRLNTASEAL